MTATRPPGRIPHVHYTFECGERQWRVRELLVEERMDAPFRAELRIVSDDDAVIDDLLGRPATLSISRGDATRIFRGETTVAEVMHGPRGTVAQVRIEPTIAGLGRAARHRVFQRQTTLAIVRDLLAPIADLRVDAELRSGFPAREYCTQYGETDLAFAGRLLAEEGATWFLEDDGAVQTIRLLDDNASFARAPGETEWRVIDTRYDEAPHESVQSLRFVRSRAALGVVDRSWDWLGGVPGIVDSQAPAGARSPVHELHHTRRSAASIGHLTARHEHERLAVLDVLGHGTSNATAFSAGRHIGVSIADEAPIELLLTRVLHMGDCPEAELGRVAGDGGPNYSNRFECQPLDVPYRPQRATKRPRMHSLQTALVVGPPDEEIHTDEHGRIRVRMHWDRSSDDAAGSSCWLRVAQSWGGQGWGTLFIPRVGMEVLVAFLDGDPDRPVCVGCVYNGAHRPPFDLPSDRTKSTIRTQSTPGGDGHNELTFDDAAGAEQVYIRAQRDLDAHVLRNLNTKVGGAEIRHVGGPRRSDVGGDERLHVHKDELRRVDGAQELHVGGSVALAVDGGPPLGDASVASPGMTVSILQGGYRLTAPQRIELVCGASSVAITPTAITIAAPAAVNLVSGGAMIALAPANLGLAAPVLSIAAPGATLGLGSTATLASAGGVKLECGDECELTLNGRATITAGEVIVDAGSRFVAMASKVELDGSEESVVRSECAVRLEDGGGRVVLRGGVVEMPE